MGPSKRMGTKAWYEGGNLEWLISKKNNNVIKKLHNHGFLLEEVEDNWYIQNR